MSSTAIVHVAARSDLRPSEAGTVRLVRVSPDGGQLAFVCDDGVNTGLYVCESQSVTARRLVSVGDAAVHELKWSPTGDHVAYVVGQGPPIGAERCVGWASSSAAGELGRVPGISFAWSAGKPALIVADVAQHRLVHIDLAGTEPATLGEILDDGAVDSPPSIAAASTGKHIAFSCRSRHRDMSEVWIIERVKGGMERTLLTQIPGADVGVSLFWTPKGKSLAMNIVHSTVRQSAIIVVQGLKGDGEVLHHHDGLDASLTPAWSPDGRWIAMFCGMGATQQRLAMLDVRARKLLPVDGVVPLGTPHFIDDGKLAIDCDTSAVLLDLKPGGG